MIKKSSLVLKKRINIKKNYRQSNMFSIIKERKERIKKGLPRLPCRTLRCVEIFEGENWNLLDDAPTYFYEYQSVTMNDVAYFFGRKVYALRKLNFWRTSFFIFAKDKKLN